MNVIGLASKPANRLMKMHDVLYVFDRLSWWLMDAKKSVLRIRIQEVKNYPQTKIVKSLEIHV
jgi:hypothetical protein